MGAEILPRSMKDLVQEGALLLKGRPFCRKMVDDFTAVTLMAGMQAAGFTVATADAEQCIRRMRITVDTGIYPDALLHKASAEGSASRP